MKREFEKFDIRSLEDELKRQYFRYSLAIKDGAVGSIIADVSHRIADLEERLQQLKRESQPVTYQ